MNCLHHRFAFDKDILGANSSNIKAFWKKMPPRPGMESKPHWRERCIPIGFHGDGAHPEKIHLSTKPSADSLGQALPQCW